MAIKEGFFAKINNKPVGGYDNLNDARTEARRVGKDIPIYFGVVETDDNGKVIKEDLYLIPKVMKEKD